MSSLNLRRLRQNEHVRTLTREVHVRLEQLIQPLFVAESIAAREAVPGLTGVHQETPDSLLRQVEQDLAAGVRKFLLFGVPRARSERDIDWSFTAGQIRALKAALWQGHLAGHRRLPVLLDAPRALRRAERRRRPPGQSRQRRRTGAGSRGYAQAGADCVAPSDMMDGRIGAIRAGLDANALERTILMSYAVKFHSSLYGPFRVAADSAPKGGGSVTLTDRATYQLDPARPSDAWLCAERDADEGADILMVKPGLPYLDLLRELSAQIRKPWAVYHVSGEFAALEALVGQGLASRAPLHREIMTAFVRAGASMIITYGARYAREWLAA